MHFQANSVAAALVQTTVEEMWGKGSNKKAGMKEKKDSGFCGRLLRRRRLAGPLGLLLLVMDVLLHNLAHVVDAGIIVRLPFAVFRPIWWQDGYLVHDDDVLALPRHVVDGFADGQEKAYSIGRHPSRNGSSKALALFNVLSCPCIELFNV